ncbi:MAG: pirin family protein [Chloroflexi bacterium]|nr:pirin family protein [Chloroflexota bacterium]
MRKSIWLLPIATTEARSYARISGGIHRSTNNPHFAQIVIRRDDEIYSADGGWFHARWHFSFDQYYDPSNMGIGTLRVFNHDTLAPGALWPMHPHRDVEGITYVVAGTFEHADGLGNDGVLYPGGAQRMTLGSGSEHSERNHSKTEPMQFIQMWIMPDRRGLTPSVEHHQFTLDDRRNRLLQIVRPENSQGVGIIVHQNASVYVSHLDQGMTIEHIFGNGRRGYLYLIEGNIELNGERVAKGGAAKVLGHGLTRLHAQVASELILVDTVL